MKKHIYTIDNRLIQMYYTLVSKEDYLQFETGNFIKQYHENSFISLLWTIYEYKELTDDRRPARMDKEKEG